VRAKDTCWTLIRGASEGRASDRDLFVTKYGPVIRAYIGARWRGSRLLQEIDDTVQEVFVACFREGGVLDAVDPDRGAFRPFLFGTIRNVARQAETRKNRSREKRLDTVAVQTTSDPDEASLEAAFDRAWALAIVEQATVKQRADAAALGERGVKRAELLRLRFSEGMPIREIARLWDIEAATLHHEFAIARREFQVALVDVVLFHVPGSRKRATEEARELLALLSV
jgi:RNA polymerase sigma factor (sigma-70 family)